LPGHFPGSPIVPAVVILDEVLAAVRAWRGNSRLIGIPLAKFLAPLRPEQAFTICLSTANDAGSEIDFCCRIPDRVIAEGRFQISDRTGEFANMCPSQSPPFEIRPHDPRLAEQLKDYPARLFSEQLYQSIELMERYSIELAVDLLRRLDLIEALGQWRLAEELCATMSFQSRFRFALGWILERLVETECIEARTEGETRRYRLRREPWQTNLPRLREIGLEIDPGNAATLDLLDRAAALYPAVARGEQSAEQSLFDPEGIALWLNYFANHNPTYAVNNWVTAVVLAQRLEKRPRLRILEIGAGAGSASHVLLQWFRERGLLRRIQRYLVTEPNAFFRRRAQRDLANEYVDLPLEWGPVDLNQRWAEQGIAPGEFDLVFGVNVLHVAKDLFFSLNEARTALANDGWLVIGECLRPHPNQPIYPELMFQILDSFTDVDLDPDIRPNPGFLTPEQWRSAFRRASFANVGVAPEIEKIREFYPHFFTGAICGQK
jgi:3-hydroxyacyl-[acyl-carrier-protein] dehydratase